jgi:RNA polymerase sigma-70 factor (ECF subfamily)
MTQDETAIIIRILDGEQELYGLLIDRYKTGLYRHCFKLVHDEDWAEDIAQDAFIKAYTQLESYDNTHRFSTWLYKIATNIALQQLRRKRPLRLDEDGYERIVSTLPDTVQGAVNAELHTAIDMLPENHKAVIQLHYLQGKSYDQIAKQMHTTTGSVKGWMSRAKRQLKEILA